jgi:aquaporin NIP
MIPMRKRLVAECFGTFCLVFIGTGAVVVSGLFPGTITHADVAITFGLVVLALVYALGDVSGAHMNPAVTLGFALARRMAWRDVPGYVVSQCVGALLASGALRLLFPLHETLGATLPSGALTQSFMLEILLTLLLMMVVLSVSTGAKERGITAGIAVGATVAIEAMFAGPVCGASMNPARSLGPAVVSMHTEYLWLYLIAPCIGAALAVPLCCAIREKGCCCQSLSAKECES